MPPKKKSQKTDNDDSSISMVSRQDGGHSNTSMNMSAFEKGIEYLYDCRLNQQTTKLNEVFTKHSQMTKDDLDETKESQEFLGSKFDELVTIINEVKHCLL